MITEPTTKPIPRSSVAPRLDLHEIPLSDWLARACEDKVVVATMALDQWDRFLATVYEHGGILLEVDDTEQLVRAYQQHTPTQEESL